MKQRYFSTFQLILLALFSALVVVAKIALRTPLQLPGHTGIFWMAIIVVGTKVVPKIGAGTIIGITSGLLASFLGLGDFGALDTFLSYAAIGVVADLILLLLGGNSENLVIAIIVGIFGHMGKFLVKWIFGIISGAPLGFVALGLLRSVIGYILFGAIGGFLGWLTLKALRRAGFFAYLAEKR
jgi:hypothetical protein